MLLDFLISFSLVIINDRSLSDEQRMFTFCSSVGKSIMDLTYGTKELDFFNDFEVSLNNWDADKVSAFKLKLNNKNFNLPESIYGSNNNLHERFIVVLKKIC